MTNAEKTFYEMCKRHDLTFEMSDDFRWYKEGCKSLDAIRDFAKQLLRSRAVEIWNLVCDEKLNPDGAKRFYWRE